jgi:hypothetical protein
MLLIRSRVALWNKLSISLCLSLSLAMATFQRFFFYFAKTAYWSLILHLKYKVLVGGSFSYMRRFACPFLLTFAHRNEDICRVHTTTITVANKCESNWPLWALFIVDQFDKLLCSCVPLVSFDLLKVQKLVDASKRSEIKRKHDSKSPSNPKKTAWRSRAQKDHRACSEKFLR